MSKEQQDREAFEAWAESKGLPLSLSYQSSYHYAAASTSAAWNAWQARTPKIEALRAKIREQEHALQGVDVAISMYKTEAENLRNHIASLQTELSENARIIGASGEQELKLIARVEQLEKALKRLSCLGNGSEYGNSEGNLIAQQALAQADASKTKGEL